MEVGKQVDDFGTCIHSCDECLLPALFEVQAHSDHGISGFSCRLEGVGFPTIEFDQPRSRELGSVSGLSVIQNRHDVRSVQTEPGHGVRVQTRERVDAPACGVHHSGEVVGAKVAGWQVEQERYLYGEHLRGAPGEFAVCIEREVHRLAADIDGRADELSAMDAVPARADDLGHVSQHPIEARPSETPPVALTAYRDNSLLGLLVNGGDVPMRGVRITESHEVGVVLNCNEVGVLDGAA